MWEEREDYAWVHWFQDGQEALIDRVEKAAKRFRYSYNRIDNARILVFGERAGLDVIEVSATCDDVGTRAEIKARAEPEVIHTLRQALETVR
jgi:hypothetical protein